MLFREQTKMIPLIEVPNMYQDEYRFVNKISGICAGAAARAVNILLVCKKISKIEFKLQ